MIQTSWGNLKGDPNLLRLKGLSQQIAELAKQAKLDQSKFPALTDLDWFERAIHRASSTFTLIIIGQVSSGKSSFINSLLGRKLLVPSDRPTDGVVSVLLATDPGEKEHAEKVLLDGSIAAFASIDEATKFLRQQDTPSDQQLKCREVRLYLNEPWLRDLRIVNTPGLGDRMQAFEKAALQYLHEDESDLVVWMFFPETAANSSEIGVFSAALARRQGAVLGVVTRCLEGKEKDGAYDPKKDQSFVGEDGVGQCLKKNLGKYLQEVIFYDSHVARRLVGRMRENPELETDKEFVAQLERSGYTQFQKALTSMLGSDREQVQTARVISFLKRCRGHALNLVAAAEEAGQVFLRQADMEKAQIAAWQKVDNDIIGPARSNLKESLRTLAQEYSTELVAIMGSSAADAVEANFGLLQTLGRSLVYRTGLCDSAGDALNKKIEAEVEEGISKVHFNKRLNDAAGRAMKDHFLKLQHNLKQASELGNDRKDAANIPIDTGKPAGGAGEVVGEAIASASKVVIAGLLKALAKELEERAAIKAAEVAGTQVAKTAAVGTASRALGIVTLVLIPFDIKKLMSEFKTGKKNLADTVRVRYQADRPVYEHRIFDTLWAFADKALSDVLLAARTGLGQRKDAHTKYLSSAQQVDSLCKSLSEIAAGFTEQARE